jgi:hypothetical protein
VSHDDYRRALDAAVREYEQALADRAALETRLAQLQQTIGTLTKLCGFTPTVPLGLTDACRMVLANAATPLTPTAIRDRLDAVGVDLSRYSNPLAAIHTVLKRLVEAGELHAEDADEANRTVYQSFGPRWRRAADPPAPPARRPAGRRPARSKS